MPELPEVETVVRLLRPDLAGRTVRKVRVRWPKTVGGNVRAFQRAVEGSMFGEARRRAKFLVFPLSRGGVEAGALVGHLRMTGRMHLRAGDAPADPYERVRLDLDDGRAFAFDDVRKFGRLVFTQRAEEALGALGPEPLEPAFDGAWLHAALRARRRLLKPLLLDQTFLAGLGNIYVDESLFEAGLHPLTPSDRVPADAAARLAAAVRGILARAIERRGTSFDAFYRTPEGRPGDYQDQLRVYDREGGPCVRCPGTVRRIVVGQRGTHLCPRCQPPPRQRRVKR
jgi:formamidopyrimidine-DNA glycosylase